MTGQSLHYWIDELGGGTLKDVVGDDVPGAEEDHDVAVVSIGEEQSMSLAGLHAHLVTCLINDTHHTHKTIQTPTSSS